MVHSQAFKIFPSLLLQNYCARTDPQLQSVDAQMIQDAARFTMDLPTSLSRTLSGNVKPMITQCSIRHLYALPTSEHPHKETLIATAKTMERRRCNHHTLDEPLSTLDCLKSVIDPKSVNTDQGLVNKFNYVVAVQDEEVRRWCRGVRGVPLVYVKRSVMVMEPMNEGSLGVREGVEKGKMRSGLRGRVGDALGKRKRGEGDGMGEGQEGADEAAKPEKKARKKGPKGPNPLSVKKSKKPTQTLGKPGVGVEVAEEPGTLHTDGMAMANAEPESTKRKRRRKHRSKPSDESKMVENGDVEDSA